MAGVQVRWESPVAAIGGKEASKIKKATGIETVGDLLGVFPRRYVRKGSLSELDDLNEGDLLTMVGEVVSSVQKPYQDRRTHRTAYRLEVRVRAEDGSLTMTYFDRQKHTADWRAKQMPQGAVGLFVGRLKWFNGAWQLTNPESRMYGDQADDAFARMPDLIPIYPAVAGINPWNLENAIAMALDLVEDVPDVLPPSVREAEDLVTIGQALRGIHRPDNWGQKVKAAERLKYDEAFVTQTLLARRRAAIEATVANPRPGRSGGLLDRFDERLPFALTDGQRAIGEEIAAELGQGHPMHRLLQGEVGSGKTVVALRAMLQVIDSGGQAALLAPTEVLAQQHHRSIVAMLGDLAEGGFLGGAEGATRVALLTGSLNAASRRTALAEAAGGEAGIVIGTHALLEEHVQFAELGLVVVDEQHRFGVEQRAALSGKAGRAAARARDDRDADPAHGRDDGVRRPRHLHADRAPGRAGRRADHRRTRRPPGLARPRLAADPRGGRPGPSGVRRVLAHRPRRGGRHRSRTAPLGRGDRRGARRGPAVRPPRRDAARADGARGQGPGDAVLRRR